MTQFIARFKILAQQETPAERRQRMVPGIIYGLIIAGSYAIVSGTVNQLSFPDLPLAVEWRALFITWLFFSVWLGAGGGFVNWFTQTEESIIPAFIVMMLTALSAGALSLEDNLPARLGKTILLVLPVIAVSLTATLILRLFGLRHAEFLQKKKSLRIGGILLLTALALLLGGGTGFAMTRWDYSTVTAVRDIDRRLQALAADSAQANQVLPRSNLPELSSHLGVPYVLLGKAYGQLVTAVQVTARFKDGYQFTCVVLLVDPGKLPSLRVCAEGNQIWLPDT